MSAQAERSLMPKTERSLWARIMTQAKYSEPRGLLKKGLTTFNLIALGIALTIGSGVYSMIGPAAQQAGPSVVFSLVISGVVCFLTCFPYMEFSRRIQSAGFTYSYVYSVAGELLGYITAVVVHVCYIANAAIPARGWAIYLPTVFKLFGVEIPKWLYSWNVMGVDICLLSGIIIYVFMFLMLLGMKESTTVNNVTTVLSIATMTFVILALIPYVKLENWTPFFPGGLSGVFNGLSLTMFLLIGFESVTCFSEDATNPSRDIPVAIAAVLCTSILVHGGVALMMTGASPIKDLNVDDSLIAVFRNNCPPWIVAVVAVGSMTGLTSAFTGNLLAEPRVLYSQACDGLLPEAFCRTNPRTNVLTVSVIVGSSISAFLAAFVPLTFIGDIVSLTGVLAYALVDLSVVIYRYDPSESNESGNPSNQSASTVIRYMCALFYGLSLLFSFSLSREWPIYITLGLLVLVVVIAIFIACHRQTNIPKNYACPFVPWLPLLGVLANIWLGTTIGINCWVAVCVMIPISIIIYFMYAYHHSQAQFKADHPSIETAALAET